MKLQKQIFRPLFFLFLLMCLLSGLVGVVRVPVKAAPLAQIASDVVISEFRTTGPAGGTDEFIEIFNPTNVSIPITGWKIQKSAGCGAVNNTPLLTFPANTSIVSGQHLLITGAGYSGVTTSDFPTTLGIADDGGIALINLGNTIVDQVGMCLTTAYKEGTSLTPLSGTANQSYERINASCTDTNNNAADFIWNQTTSNPQNSLSASIPSPCLGVIKVDSAVANVTYSVGAVIPIQVTFNNNVNVTGIPLLILETGSLDTSAIYSSGDGTPTLTFNYTVQATDASAHLDYVATNSLILNGGSITGAVGNADLTLPMPGAAGSLAANNNIVISNGAAPSITSIKRQIPISVFTNADTLTFRVTFSQTVINVDSSDFVATGISGLPTPTISISIISGSVYDVTVSGFNLVALNGIVGLDLNSTQNISNGVLPLPLTEPIPANDEVYTVDNFAPTIRIDQAVGQVDPTTATPVVFSVVFSEPINVGSFTSADVNETGTANFITWNISIDPSDTNNTKFILSATAIGSIGGVTPFIDINKVTDLAGNFNTISSTSTPPTSDGTVNFNDNVPPTVTVDQATLPTPQADPTNTLPIKFTVVFSEPIITSIFIPADITQNGSATGVTWSITNSGDNMNFTLSATAVTGAGTLQPSIAANRVTDLVGNNNSASTTPPPNYDNTVTYFIPAVPTPAGFLSVIINEVAWMGTGASASDEWIELYNPSTTATVDLTGWVLKADDTSPNIVFPAGKSIPPGGFFLLERTNDNTVIDDTINATAKLVYTGELGNSFEVLRLFDSSNRLIDTANSNGGNWPAGITTSTTHGTMERRGVVVDSDTAWITNVNTASWTKHDSRGINSTTFLIHGTPGYANWAFSVTATPSPIPTNTIAPTKFKTSTPAPLPLPPPQPLVAINEFVPRPGHDWNNDGVIDVGDEYIELVNYGKIDVNLSGYSLDDEANIGSTPYRLPAVTLKPGERMVFYGKETGLLLSDGGDGVRLLKPNGQLGDAYNYTVVNYPDQAYCRMPDNGGDLDDFTKNCFPTPGLKNSLSGSFVRPPTQKGDDPPECPISDISPIDFAWAECPSFGNIWSRFYWDAKGWFGEKSIPDLNSKWDVYVD